MIIVVAICGLVLGQAAAEHRILDEARTLVGSKGANTLQQLIHDTRHPSTGIVATIIAIVTLLFGASGAFSELRASLNTIWDVKPAPSSAWKSLVWQRLTSFGMVLAIGVLLLVSLLLSAAMAVIEQFFSGMVPIHPVILELANLLLSTAAIGALFALIFKYVPDVRIAWRDVAVGAFATAVLFTAGKFLLAWYLSTAAVGSAYGAAGSIVALVVWVYYSAQIFLFGAVFTREYATELGTHTKSVPVKQPISKSSSDRLK